MSFCVSNLCWSFKDDRAYKILKENQINYIEISPVKSFGMWENINVKSIKQYNKTLLDHGLSVASIQSIFFQKKINMFENNAMFIEQFKKVIDLSSQLDCKYIVYGSPETRSLNEVGIEKANEVYLSTFEKISKYNNEIVIGIEPNPKYYNCFFMNTYEKITKANALLPKNICFHFDYACISLGGDDPNEIFDLEKESLKHLHVSSKDLKSIADNKDVIDFVNSKYRKDIVFSMEMLNLEEQEFLRNINLIRKIKEKNLKGEKSNE
jgi:sugar phosphate isomerase/epimerase